VRNIPTDLLRTFVTVLDLGSHSRAGERLGRSQPTVSLQIRRLQHLLDTTLLEKSAGESRLTEDGETVAAYARRMLALNFELDPTLFVSLDFDQAVQIGGELVTTLVSAWDLLPDITFLSDVTAVTPTFFMQADLTNRTLLDFDLLGEGSFGIGNVLAQGIDLFDSPDLFNSLFALGGFSLQVGESFVIDFLTGPSAPSTTFVQSAVNEIVAQANPSSVSESDTAVLLLLGLAGLYASRRSPRHGAQRCALQPRRLGRGLRLGVRPAHGRHLRRAVLRVAGTAARGDGQALRGEPQ